MKQRIPSSPSKVTKVLALSTEADTWMPTQKTFLFVGSLKQEPTLVQVWARNQAQRINHDWHMEVIVTFARECLVGIWPTHFQGNVPEKIFFLIKRGKKCVKKRSPLSSWKLVKRCSCLVLWQPHCENEGKLRELKRRFPCGVAEPNPGVTYLVSCHWGKITPHCLFHFGRESYLWNWKHSVGTKIFLQQFTYWYGK